MARCNQSTYCTRIGRSKPYNFRMASMSASDAVSPAIAIAGSLERYNKPKLMKDTVNATKVARPSLLMV